MTRQLHIAVFALLSIGIVSSCNGPKKASGTQTATDPEIQDTPELVLEYTRGACFGECPVDALRVYENGSFLYKGRMFVPNVGQFKGEVSPERLKQLLDQIEDSGFFGLQDEYEPDVTDLPSYTVYAKQGDREHRVVAEASYPDTLRTALKLLNRFVEELEMTEAISKP